MNAKRKLYASNQQKQMLSSLRNDEFNKKFLFEEKSRMELKIFLHETKNLTKISFTKTNGSNAEIKYFEFSLLMIKKNT